MAEGFDWRTLVGALSSLAPVLAQAHASNAAQNELAAGRQNVYAQQQKADQAIGDAINVDNDAGAANAQRQKATANYANAVRKVRGAGDASVAPGLGGDRYAKDVSTLSSQGAAYGGHQADLAARIDAPTFQRQREGAAAATAASTVDRAASGARSADFVSRLRAQQAGQTSPWLAVLAQLGSKIAKNYQKPGERGPDMTGLEPIDLSTLPQRLPPPRRAPAMQPFPQLTEG